MIIFSQDISFKGHLDGVGQSNSWGGQTGPWGGQLPPLTGPNGAYAFNGKNGKTNFLHIYLY